MTYEVVEHRLTAAEFRRSPNVDRSLAEHYALLYHYAGSRSTGELIGWFLDDSVPLVQRVSCHLVILRDGRLYQYVPFDRRAWHAGDSSWRGRRWANNWTLGIELEGDGELARDERGWYRPWSGRRWESRSVVEATHEDGTHGGWTVYTDRQIKAAVEVGRVLHATYRFAEVLGHDDVSPGRKHDPGPLFPIEMVRRLVLEE